MWSFHAITTGASTASGSRRPRTREIPFDTNGRRDARGIRRQAVERDATACPSKDTAVDGFGVVEERRRSSAHDRRASCGEYPQRGVAASSDSQSWSFPGMSRASGVDVGCVSNLTTRSGASRAIMFRVRPMVSARIFNLASGFADVAVELLGDHSGRLMGVVAGAAGPKVHLPSEPEGRWTACIRKRSPRVPGGAGMRGR